MKELVLVKLGGSIITDKNTQEQADIKTIKRLAENLYKVYQEGQYHLLIGHGAGSFGHPPAKKYDTMNGLKGYESCLGMAEVKEAMARLNQVVIEEFVRAGLPAITVPPFATITAKGRDLDKLFLTPFLNLLNNGLVPVIHGDVISDVKIGCTIYSGETVLNILAIRLKRFFHPKVIIEVGLTRGVLDMSNSMETVPEVTAKNFTEIEQLIRGSHGVDVTGGMIHKVKEALDLAKSGIHTLIISAEGQNLYKAIVGEQVEGTLIH